MDNKQIVSVNEINISKVCLLCLENNDTLVEIFGEKGIDLNIAAVINEHFWFEVKSEFDGCCEHDKTNHFLCA